MASRPVPRWSERRPARSAEGEFGNPPRLKIFARFAVWANSQRSLLALTVSPRRTIPSAAQGMGGPCADIPNPSKMTRSSPLLDAGSQCNNRCTAQVPGAMNIIDFFTKGSSLRRLTAPVSKRVWFTASSSVLAILNIGNPRSRLDLRPRKNLFITISAMTSGNRHDRWVRDLDRDKDRPVLVFAGSAPLPQSRLLRQLRQNRCRACTKAPDD